MAAHVSANAGKVKTKGRVVLRRLLARTRALPGSMTDGGSDDRNTARIREFNDAFRKTLVGSKVAMTAGVAELLTW
jgi:hypothetical protein